MNLKDMPFQAFQPPIQGVPYRQPRSLRSYAPTMPAVSPIIAQRTRRDLLVPPGLSLPTNPPFKSSVAFTENPPRTQIEGIGQPYPFAPTLQPASPDYSIQVLRRPISWYDTYEQPEVLRRQTAIPEPFQKHQSYMIPAYYTPAYFADHPENREAGISDMMINGIIIFLLSCLGMAILYLLSPSIM